MSRALLFVAALLLAACAVQATASYDFDEQALLAELEDRPSNNDASLLSLNDLDTEAASLLSTEEMESLESVRRHADITFRKLNKAVAQGVDVWTISSERGVYNKPFGTVIGNLPKSAHLVIQKYKYAKRGQNEVQWGYGYLSTPIGFGGWAGSNACGWFPLQRQDVDDLKQNGNLVKNIPNHPQKCPSKSKDILKRSNIFKQGSYIKDGSIVKAVTKQECPAFLNYDPATGAPCDAAPSLPAGAFSGNKGSVGTVPAGIAQKTKVKGFGVQFVTKDGKYVSVKYPGLDRANPGNTHFFVAAGCIEFDSAAVAAANGVSLVEVTATKPVAPVKAQAHVEAEAEQESELESEQMAEDEFPEEFAAMELHSESHELLDSPRPHRGNYPGWTSMLEIRSDPAPAAAPANPSQSSQAAPAPAAGNSHAAPAHHEPEHHAPPPSHSTRVGPVLKNLPAEGPNVKHITLGESEASAKLRNANVGISKVHVHVFGKADADVDKERRLNSMVKRLANNQSHSYKKINKLLAKLKKCGAKENSKDCLRKLTNKLEDWKAEWLHH